MGIRKEKEKQEKDTVDRKSKERKDKAESLPSQLLLHLQPLPQLQPNLPSPAKVVVVQHAESEKRTRRRTAKSMKEVEKREEQQQMDKKRTEGEVAKTTTTTTTGKVVNTGKTKAHQTGELQKSETKTPDSSNSNLSIKNILVARGLRYGTPGYVD